MDQNNNNQSPAPQPTVSPASQEPQIPNPLATAPVVPIGSKPDASAPGATAGIPQPAPSLSTPPTQNAVQAPPVHHKGKPMLWVIILLVFAFLCGLMLAVWYYQTKIQ